MKSKLVLVRHGQSEWNAKNLFTGWKDPKLTDLEFRKAIKAGELLETRNLKFDPCSLQIYLGLKRLVVRS